MGLDLGLEFGKRQFHAFVVRKSVEASENFLFSPHYHSEMTSSDEMCG
jgi:hypothetical protein